jgi:hypothetical protein
MVVTRRPIDSSLQRIMVLVLKNALTGEIRVRNFPSWEKVHFS